MTRSENGRGDPPPLTALGEKPDRDQTLRRIEAATDHLGRLQQIMLEMLRSDSPAAPAPAPAPPISPNLPLNLPVMSLSRQMLDQLALALGDPPLRDRAGLPQRGLRLVAGRDMPAGSGPAPLWLESTGICACALIPRQIRSRSSVWSACIGNRCRFAATRTAMAASRWHPPR